MLELHLICPNCKKTFVVYDWQLWRDSEENESAPLPPEKQSWKIEIRQG